MGNLVSYNVKPKFDALRAKFPNEMGMLIGIINKADAGEVVSAIESDGHYKVTLPTGVSVLLERDDLIIETKKTEGFEAASDYGITVALDTSLTPELIEEGSVREIISNIQKMRKNAGFEVMDRICVYQSGNDSSAAVMKKNEAEIADVCLVDSFFYGENTEIESEIKVNGEKTVIGVKKN